MLILFYFIPLGLQHILDRIPNVRGIQLDEAAEFCKNPTAPIVTYPLKAQPTKRTASAAEGVAGSSKQSEPAKKKQKKDGKLIPRDDKSTRKYSNENMPKNLDSLILKHLHKWALFRANPDLCVECLNLISNSLAKRTWSKYSSALSMWNKFVLDKKANKFQALAFMCWCSKNTSIKSSTITDYVSALRKIKFLLGFGSKKGSQSLEKIILRGIENVENKNQVAAKKVIPMDLLLLHKIKQSLDTDVCSPCSKQSIWALSVVGFWGLLRLGEVLPAKPDRFDKTSTLLWEDVKFSSDTAVLTLKSPKTRSKQSKVVVLFSLPNKDFCPVEQLKNLLKIQKKTGYGKKNLPVFLRSSGKSLTKITFLRSINVALRLRKNSPKKLQGKSFRSGIPSLLDNLNDDSMSKDLKILGRWKGPSYRCYIRNPAPKNRQIFTKVANLLLTNFLRRKTNAEADPDY
jgi:hypothetical protein